MLSSDIAIIDIKEHQVECFKVIIKLFRKATGFSNGSFYLVSKATVVTFYSYDMLFVNSFIITFKSSYNAIPVFHNDRVIADSKLLKTGY